MLSYLLIWHTYKTMPNSVDIYVFNVIIVSLYTAQEITVYTSEFNLYLWMHLFKYTICLDQFLEYCRTLYICPFTWFPSWSFTPSWVSSPAVDSSPPFACRLSLKVRNREVWTYIKYLSKYQFQAWDMWVDF